MSSTQLARVVAEAEVYVVGALLWQPGVVYPKVGGLIDENSFGDRRLGTVYRAAVEAIERREVCDTVAVAERLAQAGQLADIGWFLGLTDLVAQVGTVQNVEAWAERVIAGAELRRIAAQLHAGLAKLETLGLGDAATAADEIARLVAGEPQPLNGTGVGTYREAARDAFQDLQYRYEHPDEPVGIPTGFRDIDRRWVGMEAGMFIVIGARPSMGKSAFAVNLLTNVMKASAEDEVVVVFSTELRRLKIAARGLTATSGVSQRAFRTGRVTDTEIARLLEQVKSAHSWDDRLLIYDLPRPTTLTMRRTLNRVLCGRRSRLILCDHMHQVRPVRERRRSDEEMAEISNDMLEMGKEFGCPFVAMSQLNRTVEARPNKRPIMSDLRGSGAIEQDADIVAFLYRDEFYNENTEDKGILEVISSKVREGPPGTDRLKWIGESGQIRDLLED